ncbi:hypothetical protein EDEG_00039 [Edhazardia aedis USNM 41457]|uniref:Uncharacterized protein n=1 Tax=Edhazardia aedis (strain USNM 41457) TaxID=1003232 RepID=J9DFR6_EDHAE|nr:hypothetical protein EDEG_00039 [Edhazardia aedis USNM 41457]|eukprot:EJW01445.1 hypothetical protein EDEG_00039 [Edhazardia aedis USNM 41457]
MKSNFSSLFPHLLKLAMPKILNKVNAVTPINPETLASVNNDDYIKNVLSNVPNCRKTNIVPNNANSTEQGVLNNDKESSNHNNTSVISPNMSENIMKATKNAIEQIYKRSLKKNAQNITTNLNSAMLKLKNIDQTSENVTNINDNVSNQETSPEKSSLINNASSAFKNFGYNTEKSQILQNSNKKIQNDEPLTQNTKQNVDKLNSQLSLVNNPLLRNLILTNPHISALINSSNVNSTNTDKRGLESTQNVNTTNEITSIPKSSNKFSDAKISNQAFFTIYRRK